MVLSLQPTLAVRQQLNLTLQQINTYLLSLPLDSLDALVNAVEERPEEAERLVAERGIARAVPSLYGGLAAASEGAAGGGIVTDMRLDTLSPLLPRNPQPKPEVLYIGRENDKPEICFSDVFSIKREQRQEAIPSSLRKASYLHTILVSRRDWIARKLGELYRELGDAQREFIFTGRYADMTVFDLHRAGFRLQVSKSTISRLRKDRHVGIQIGQTYLVPAAALMPTAENVEMYGRLNLLNQALVAEQKNRKAYGYDEIKTQTGLAPRTQRTYQSMYRLPSPRGRNALYAQGKGPFSVPMTLQERAALP